MKSFSTSLFVIGFTASVTLAVGSVLNLGTLGQTYEIVEKDALDELRTAVANTDWNKVLDKSKTKESIKNYRPSGLKALPLALQDTKRKVDLTYRWDGPDITDDKGNVIYPHGYTFNPVDYMDFPFILVFIDGNDKQQVEWFSQSEYATNINTWVVLVGGSYIDIGKELNRSVYYASAEMYEKFGLLAVPSVIKKEGPFVFLNEISIKAPKKEKN